MMRFNRTTLRRLCQISVAVAFIAAPWLNGMDIRFVSGNMLFSEVAGVSFADPLAALQVFASTWSVSSTLLTGALLVLVLAAVMGPVFCGWLCPYGFIADMLQKLPFWKKRTNYIRGFRIKLVMVGVLLVGISMFQLPPLFNQLSLPGWYTRAMQQYWLSGTLPLGLLLILVAALIDYAGKGRIWCRYFCPQSLLIVLFGKLLPARFRVKYDVLKCTCSRGRISPCTANCPHGIDPREAAIHEECTNCGDCVVTCSKYGNALSQGFGSRQ